MLKFGCLEMLIYIQTSLSHRFATLSYENCTKSSPHLNRNRTSKTSRSNKNYGANQIFVSVKA